MGWLDLIIAVLVVTAALRGLQLGAVAQVSSFVGFWAGLALGVLLALAVTKPLGVGSMRAGLTLAMVLGIAAVGGVIGRIIGGWAGTTMKRLHLGTLDSGAGAALGAVAVLLSAWLVAGFLVESQIGWVSSAVDRSAVLRSVDRVLPPVPSALSQVQGLLASGGFPSVFAGIPASPTRAEPSSSAEARSLAAPALDSVVKLFAPSCGAYEEGTAFVVAEGTLVTNAHVIAGMAHPKIIVAGQAVDARAVLFDSRLDLAVLKTSAKLGPPLSFDTAPASIGERSAIVGFPDNGPEHVTRAAVAAAFTALGRDIYDAGLTSRDVLELSAEVRPGNSGSPLIGSRGTVLGVVFSRSTVAPKVGYALSASAVVPSVTKAIGLERAVSTGACTGS